MGDLKSTEEMRKLAGEATGGPWMSTEVVRVVPGHTELVGYELLGADDVTVHDAAGGIVWERDAEYIAAANPAQLLHMCDLIDSQAREIEGLREERAALRAGLRKISASSKKKGAAKRFPNTYHGGFDAGCAWAADVAARALLSPSDSGRAGT